MWWWDKEVHSVSVGKNKISGHPLLIREKYRYYKWYGVTWNDLKRNNIYEDCLVYRDVYIEVFERGVYVSSVYFVIRKVYSFFIHFLLNFGFLPFMSF